MEQLPRREARTHSNKRYSWNETKEEAFGELGLRPWEFYRYTYQDYQCLRRGVSKDRLERLRELRILCFYAASSSLKKGTKLTDIFPLPGDKGFNGKMDANRYEQIKKRLGAIQIPDLKPKTRK